MKVYILLLYSVIRATDLVSASQIENQAVPLTAPPRGLENFSSVDLAFKSIMPNVPLDLTISVDPKTQLPILVTLSLWQVLIFFNLSKFILWSLFLYLIHHVNCQPRSLQGLPASPRL